MPSSPALPRDWRLLVVLLASAVILAAGGVYAAADFTPFPRNSGSWGLNNYWDGAKWDWFAGNPPIRACSRTISSLGAMYTQ